MGRHVGFDELMRRFVARPVVRRFGAYGVLADRPNGVALPLGGDLLMGFIDEADLIHHGFLFSFGILNGGDGIPLGWEKLYP